MRQRRAWTCGSPAGGRCRARPAWLAIAVLVALLGLAIALALVGRRPTTPFRTGLLAYISGGDIYLARPDGSGAEVVHPSGWRRLPDRLLGARGRPPCLDGESGAVLVDPVTGIATFIGGHDPVWSPDGRQLAVLEPSPGSAAARSVTFAS